VETTVFLIRHGVTDWHRDRKLIGQRDVTLNADGVAQARSAAAGLAHVPVGEIISSPALRSVQTAEIIASQFKADITRDPRLGEIKIGKWEGMTYDEAARTPEYQRVVASPLTERLPGGEHLNQVRDRAIGAVEQALRDAPGGESLAIVSHASIVRVVLAHYLGISIAQFHRLRIAAGSISILSFRDDRDPPHILAVGWRPSLKEVV
jgi:broad specificity phosphatase PhoE